jgi:ubiquinone/menaquinone biosynthesis C-methylase UbiE
MSNRKNIIDANIAVHSAAAGRYKEEPHYRPENRARVRDILVSIKKTTNGNKLLDLGCGMGFVIDIAQEFFPVIRGVDVTQAMLSYVNTTSAGCDIQVFESPVEDLPFESGTFDVCTAYAVLHHLDDLDSALIEANRILRPGGVFYTDLDPNSSFWHAIKSLDPTQDYPESIRREINAVGAKDQEIAEKFGLDLDTVQLAEHWMHLDDGFESAAFEAAFYRAGFTSVKVVYHWFVGEASMIHDSEASKTTDAIRDYLQLMKPLTTHLYKYIGVIASK